MNASFPSLKVALNSCKALANDSLFVLAKPAVGARVVSFFAPFPETAAGLAPLKRLAHDFGGPAPAGEAGLASSEEISSLIAASVVGSSIWLVISPVAFGIELEDGLELAFGIIGTIGMGAAVLDEDLVGGFDRLVAAVAGCDEVGVVGFVEGAFSEGAGAVEGVSGRASAGMGGSGCDSVVACMLGSSTSSEVGSGIFLLLRLFDVFAGHDTSG